MSPIPELFGFDCHLLFVLGTAVTDTVISSSQSKKVWPISNDRYSITFMLHFTLQWICLSGLEVSAVLSERMKIWTVKAQRCCYPWVQTKWWRLQGTFSMCSLCFEPFTERHCHSQRPLALFLSGYKRLDQDVTVGVVIKNSGGINKRSGKCAQTCVRLICLLNGLFEIDCLLIV